MKRLTNGQAPGGAPFVIGMALFVIAAAGIWTSVEHTRGPFGEYGEAEMVAEIESDLSITSDRSYTVAQLEGCQLKVVTHFPLACEQGLSMREKHQEIDLTTVEKTEISYRRGLSMLHFEAKRGSRVDRVEDSHNCDGDVVSILGPRPSMATSIVFSSEIGQSAAKRLQRYIALVCRD